MLSSITRPAYRVTGINVGFVAVVLVLFGGKSAEHEVSCLSAATVRRSLEQAGHVVEMVGIALEGTWHLATDHEIPEAAGPRVRLTIPDGTLMNGSVAVGYDVVFPVLHGPFGEDGTIQGLLEVANVPYVGAGVLASAVAMDKDVANRLLREAGLPIADSAAFTRRQYEAGGSDRLLSRLVDGLGLPLFVKPAALGSSVGISRVQERFELPDAIEMAFKYGEKVVVEEAVKAREIEVAVLDGPRSSIPGEIVTKDWYDYEAKYHDDSVELLVPAPLTESAASEVKNMAERAFSALDVRGLARVDFFYEENGRGFLVNEVNTMPGCTSRSMFPMLWEASGLPNDQLFDRLVQAALSQS